MENTIIETQELTRNYGAMVAVNRISLQVPQGSIYGFLGPNGAGKTTTIRMLLGLIRPSSGNIFFFGEPLAKNPVACSKRIGSLVEMPSYYPHLTGRENLELMRRLRGAPPKAVDRALSIVNLEKDAKRLVKHYSLGMCQRLGLAMAFLGSPDVLLLDEPTNGLDPSGIHEIRELLRNLPEQYGVTVFVSSHLLSEVEQLATRIGILQTGKLIFQGEPSELHASFCDQLNIGVDRPDEARSFLRSNGWEAEKSTDQTMIVPVKNPGEAAEMNRRLHNAGFSIFNFHYQQLSLEDIFLKLTDSK